MTPEISILITVIGCIIGISGWVRTGRGDAAKQAEWQGGINIRLDNIQGKLDKLDDVRERVALTETSIRSLHKRLDEHIAACNDNN